jgi:hypothetical protein
VLFSLWHIILCGCCAALLPVAYVKKVGFPAESYSLVNQHSPVSRSGRFSDGPGADVAQFTESVSFDWRLWEQDILGSLAHAAMLQKIGILSKAESLEIETALNDIAQEICEDRFPLESGPGRRPHEHRGGIDPADARRGQAPHRPLAQRPDRPGYAHVAAR